MAAVAAMHERMQKQAREDQKPKVSAQNMGSVLGKEQHASDCDEGQQDKPDTRSQQATFILRSLI
jgi:hypothetical protein